MKTYSNYIYKQNINFNLFIIMIVIKYNYR